MRIYEKMSALSQEESDFAGKNHPILLWLIKELNIDYNEFYDVAVMGYLKAVKKWFSRMDLREKYSFVTIAKYSVRSYVGNDRRKKNRRIQTVSLDAVIPGTDGLTLIEAIADTYSSCYQESNENIYYINIGFEYGKEHTATL